MTLIIRIAIESLCRQHAYGRLSLRPYKRLLLAGHRVASLSPLIIDFSSGSFLASQDIHGCQVQSRILRSICCCGLELVVHTLIIWFDPCHDPQTKDSYSQQWQLTRSRVSTSSTTTVLKSKREIGRIARREERATIKVWLRLRLGSHTRQTRSVRHNIHFTYASTTKHYPLFHQNIEFHHS